MSSQEWVSGHSGDSSLLPALSLQALWKAATRQGRGRRLLPA
jgi:hypothetical protein